MFDKKQNNEKEPKLLITVSSNADIGIVNSILEENGIPCLVQDRGVGGYMRLYAGNSIFGTDIYVAPENFEKAKELISVLDLEKAGEALDEEELAKEALEAENPEEA